MQETCMFGFHRIIFLLNYSSGNWFSVVKDPLVKFIIIL